MGGYTVGELERDTGFSRRTIAYYVQLGLLPRVGRLGPKTRYPEQVRDRLRFIRRVREAQEAGEVPPVSLSDIREVFENSPARLISSVAAERTPVTPALFSPPGGPGLAAPSRRRAALEDRMERRMEVREEAVPYRQRRMPDLPRRAAAEFAPYLASSSEVLREREPRVQGQPPESGGSAERDLAGLLAMLEQSAGLLDRIRSSRVEQWSRFEITPDIALSVRGLPEEEAESLEALGEKLRRLIRQDQDSMP